MPSSVDTSSDKFLARFVLACVAYYVVAIVLLHILSPEIDPRHQFMSEYVVGRFSGLMTTTFFVLSAASLALSIVFIRRRHAIFPSRLGILLFILWALLVCVAGTFATDPDNGPRSTAGFIHGITSMFGFMSLIIALPLLSWAFRKPSSALRRVFTPAFALALGVILAFVGIMAGLPYTGLIQRLLLGLVLAWHALIAIEIQAAAFAPRLSAAQQAAPGDGPGPAGSARP